MPTYHTRLQIDLYYEAKDNREATKRAEIMSDKLDWQQYRYISPPVPRWFPQIPTATVIEVEEE